MNWFSKRFQVHLLENESAELSNEKRQKILRQTIELDRSRFQRAISSVHAMLSEIDTDWKNAAVYDLAIWSIGRSVAADGCSDLMLGKYVQENKDIAYFEFPDLPAAHGSQQAVDLAKCNAYTGCWSYERIPSSIASLFKNGYQQPKNSNGVYYPELRLAVMYNGRHHTSWATFLDDCTVMLDTVHLTPYFDVISTDGAFYEYVDKDGFPQHLRVRDYRMAVLFQLAKECSILDPPHTADAYAQRKTT